MADLLEDIANVRSKRMFKEPLNEGRDVITVEELDFMLDEYYKLRGWDSQGRPSVK